MYDQKCYDLAAYFLEDEAGIINTHEHCDDMAERIQATCEAVIDELREAANPKLKAEDSMDETVVTNEPNVIDEPNVEETVEHEKKPEPPRQPGEESEDEDEEDEDESVPSPEPGEPPQQPGQR